MAYSSGFRRGMILAATISLALSIPALAQGPGGGGGGPGGGGGGPGGGGGGGLGGGSLGGGGGGLGGGGRGGAGGAGGAGALNNLGTGAVGARSTGGTNAPAASNFLGGFYSYPTVTALPPVSNASGERTQGVQSSVAHTVPAFGGPTFSTTGAAGGGGGARGTATIRGGGRAGLGGTGTQAEGFNAGTTGSQLPRMPRYATALRFRAAPVTTDRVVTDVQNVLRRSNSIPSKDQISVQVNGRDVILRGNVSSEDEKRHVEALIRLTPGVGGIINELSVVE